MNLPGDNPLRDEADDELDRATLARRFARQLCDMDASEGAVVGVLGPWGSGKTTFVNFARAELSAAGVGVIDFNPWMFSGAGQLVDSFFNEIGAQVKLGLDMKDLGESIQEYGELFSGLGWIPLVGPWIERVRLASSGVGKAMARRKEGITDRRSKLAGKLNQLVQPIVVVLDDIDRLTTTEIRDVFKLIRLTASFPNIIYLVAFDRQRVEAALGEDGLPGRAYLEKIIQVTLDLPVIPDQVLTTRTLQTLDKAIGDIDHPGELDEALFADVFTEIIRPLITNMRDVRRYAAAAHNTVDALNGEIALVDVLGLEAIRVFIPDVFAVIPKAVDGLTTPSDVFRATQQKPDPSLEESVKALLEAAGSSHEAVVRAMIMRLFPPAARFIGGSHSGSDWHSTWLRGSRVAHPDILKLYLERVAGEGLVAFREAEQAWQRLADATALDAYMRGLEPERRQTVVTALENYQSDFTAEQVVPATTVLLNLIPDMPDQRRGMFSLTPSMAVIRVVFRLLKSLGQPERVEASAHEIFPKLETLSAQLDLIAHIGHRKDAGGELITETAAATLEREWRDGVRRFAERDLASEYDLLRVLAVTKRESQDDEPPLEIPNDPPVTLRLFESAVTEVRGATIGNRSVRSSARLAWTTLVFLLENEKTVRERWEAVIAAQLEVEPSLKELVERYLSGWRPKDFE